MIPDGVTECPHCHAAVTLTQKIDMSGVKWCPTCGALVSSKDDVCPKCGSVLGVAADPAAKRRVRELDIPDLAVPEKTGDLRAVAGRVAAQAPAATIESAIPPSGPDAPSASMRHDRLPRTKVFAFAAVLAVVVVGGSALLITHPWDPTITQTRTTVPADTSTAGSPGSVSSLAGQDTGKEGGTANTTYDTLKSSWEKLSELAQSVDESEADLKSTGISGDSDARAAGLSDATAISLKVSNLISDLGELNDGAGLYTDDISNVKTLGSWLRNRCDALTEAWQKSVDSDDPSADSAKILSGISSSYKDLFDENYASWEPSEKSQ